MEIIKAAEVAKQIECNHCGSELRYTPQDVKTYFPSQAAMLMYGNEAVPMRYIECPVCGKDIWLD